MKKRIISLLCAVLMMTAVCVPAFAAENNETDVISDDVEMEAEDISGVPRAPEYIRIKSITPYNCYTTSGKTAAEGAKIACQVKYGDYLMFINLMYDSNGRQWVKGQILGSHPCYGWYVWLLYSSADMSIGY